MPVGCRDCQLRWKSAPKTADGKPTYSVICKLGYRGGCPNPDLAEITAFDKQRGRSVGNSPRTPPLQFEKHPLFNLVSPFTRSWQKPRS